MTNNSVNLIEMGERIKLLRTKQKKTQKYFADMIFISPSYLALIEQGKRTATIDVLAQIAKVCDVSTDYLLFGTSDIQQDSNQKTLQRLSECYSSEAIKNSLSLAEYFLSLEYSDNPD